ncbi:hypothetical protein LP52_03400 [Streptomonospora alba]|uniref:Uncharacterized protein n=1 Tax=Streptomonospora alba TaxID=183763 RepID=A0A0C2JF87_9ACTN|nr:hypothetical protein [Streptomonospora alba]KII00007.1 hypothetical protein LP52_03400 [Streptomonospora alba]
MSANDAESVIPRQRDGFELTRAERAELQELVEELVAATEDRVFWLGRVRETALEIQRRLGAMLDRAD